MLPKHLKSSCGPVTHTNRRRIGLLAMWLYKSYCDFILEATGAHAQKEPNSGNASSGAVDIKPETTEPLILPKGKWPPVIVGNANRRENPPMLEGRHRQQLPQVPGRFRGWLRAGDQNNEHFSREQLAAWFVPCRIGTEEIIRISDKSGTVLKLNVSDWPTAYDGQKAGQMKILRRAANILQIAPDVFETVSSVANAYESLEDIWNRLVESDPQVELLLRHAKQLRKIFEDLRVRPRAVLKTEHRMQKLQKVRRIDVKTLQWLSAQPGRNTAERAGSGQRIKAPKRYESINTLENRVLRAFAALTVRSTNELLNKSREIAPYRAILEAHRSRAQRIENMLLGRNVPEASPYVRPNFPLRFDLRYNKIWCAWLELRRENSATELDWMWQHRTFMEILGLRAAMLFHKKTHNPPNDGNIAHFPVLRASQSKQVQGCHLESHGIRATYRVCHEQSKKDDIYQFCTVNSDDDLPLGAITTINFTENISRKNAILWWNIPNYCDSNKNFVGVEALPWDVKHIQKKGWVWNEKWEDKLDWWIDSVLS